MEGETPLMCQFVLYEYGYPCSDPLRALAAVREYLNGIIFMVFSDFDCQRGVVSLLDVNRNRCSVASFLCVRRGRILPYSFW
jgi:hypothetical protein